MLQIVVFKFKGAIEVQKISEYVRMNLQANVINENISGNSIEHWNFKDHKFKILNMALFLKFFPFNEVFSLYHYQQRCHGSEVQNFQ